MLKIKVFKVLSKNDTGETNSHQSGISIPKAIARENIFPQLGNEVLNPRVSVSFMDEDNNIWNFQYIYYNDVYFGKNNKCGHNEYRLTCVKEYIRHNSICAGDSIWFGLDDDNTRRIGFVKNNDKTYEKDNEGNVILEIKGGWHYIQY